MLTRDHVLWFFVSWPPRFYVRAMRQCRHANTSIAACSQLTTRRESRNCAFILFTQVVNAMQSVPHNTPTTPNHNTRARHPFPFPARCTTTVRCWHCLSSDSHPTHTPNHLCSLAWAIMCAQWPGPIHLVFFATSLLWFAWFSTRSRYHLISDAHCIPVTVLALLAINGFIPEWTTMIFSATYMVRHVLVSLCVRAKFALHAVHLDSTEDSTPSCMHACMRTIQHLLSLAKTLMVDGEKLTLISPLRFFLFASRLPCCMC
jgi:hypothetical protein